ncbi:hypothetical protein TNCV_1573741 [Trichonephila clavipes]|nr:hypothetical protein TNCV_1573741 [Trichonephila clavipes]
MITTSYRVRAAVGVRHLFPSRHYSAIRSHLGARGTMTYLGHVAVGVRRVEALLCCPFVSCCTRNGPTVDARRWARSVHAERTRTSLTLGGGCSLLFSVETLLCCPVALGTRNIDYRVRASWCIAELCPVASTPTSYRSRSAVGVRQLAVSRRARGTLFSVEALLYCPVASCARGTMVASCCRRRNDDNDILPRRAAVGVRHPFSVTTLLSGASWCTLNDDNDILPQTLGGGCSSPFSVDYSLSGRVLVHAER